MGLLCWGTAGSAGGIGVRRVRGGVGVGTARRPCNQGEGLGMQIKKLAPFPTSARLTGGRTKVVVEAEAFNVQQPQVVVDGLWGTRQWAIQHSNIPNGRGSQ